MRLILSITFVFLALMLGGSVPAQEKDKDKKDEPGVKEITEIGGKTFEQWLKEMHHEDRSRAEIAITTIPGFPFAKSSLALPEMMKELEAPVGKLDANSRLGLISAVSTIIGSNPSKVSAEDLKRAVTIFTNSVHDPQMPVRIRAMAALANLGSDAQPALDDLLNEISRPIDVEQRVAAINAVGLILGRTQKRDPNKLTRALILLGSNTENLQLVVRISALNALRFIGPDASNAIPRIILQLHEKKGTWEVRQAAALALGTVGFDAFHQNESFKNAQKALIGSLPSAKEPCSQVRAAAINSLAIHGVPHVWGADAKDPKKKAPVAKVFTKDAPVIVALDAVAFKDPEPSLQINATLAVMKLTRSVPKANLEHLIQLMKHDDAAIRVQATQSIGTIGPKAKDAVPELMDRVYDKAQPVTLMAIWALSRMGKDATIALPILNKYKADKDSPEALKKAADEAIKIIEGKEKVKDTK